MRLAFCLVFALFVVPPAQAQRAEYRAFWVDTFNTNLNNHADVVAVVNNAKATKANAIFAQVRRRGDSWYLNSLEPKADRTPIEPGFDPLQDLVNEAHANGIEVHAFVIMSAIWGRAPNLFPPENPNHAFNLHGGFKPGATPTQPGTIEPGPNNWLTRTLLPDGGGITYQGHRFGSDFWIDFGHPDAAAYTVDVLMHLVRNYDIDGLHLDRIRYPEFTASGQTPANGTNIGYNTTSVARFNARHNRTGNPLPSDNLWKQWRRDQVSNVVRRVYLNAIAVKPQIKVSAALIAFGGGPVCNAGADCKAVWQSSFAAEAYWRVYQDWRSWTEEGILDLAVPMNYKREHPTVTPPSASQAGLYDTWNEWIRNHQYNRMALVGQGAFLNFVEGTLRQTRRALAPSAATGNRAGGVVFFSMATTNVSSFPPPSPSPTPTPTPNPFTNPPNQLTTLRPFAEFASAMTTGKSVNGATLYEPDANAPGFEAVFSQQAAIPILTWKVAPTVGHLMGFARRANTSALDTATVTIENIDTSAARKTATDGGGFYGGVDLAPGSYFVRAELGTEKLFSCVAQVAAGQVTTADLGEEKTAPATTPALAPAPNANGWHKTDVSVALNASDDCAGVASTEFSTDGGATWTPYTSAFAIDDEGTTTVLYRSTDRAGNVETAQRLVVMIDKTAPTLSLSADPSVIWPPNGQTVKVNLNGVGADSLSGLAGVSYVVTDEYGAPLSIAPRSLAGAQGEWAEVLGVEARREGDDRDGRLYRVVATVTDAAGNTATAEAAIIVPHDQRAP